MVPRKGKGLDPVLDEQHQERPGPGRTARKPTDAAESHPPARAGATQQLSRNRRSGQEGAPGHLETNSI
jgi:hypothetical protein